MDPFHTSINVEGDGDRNEEIRRGPWTLEEDTLLIRYISCHGEGRWNLLAKAAGLKRTGKSCRLRWLNYLKPDIKRGNLSPQEQLLILELHSKWGNRWSKIAQHLPGRTDNEIKNYWRTRVQKQAKQLNMESNSQSFIDAIRCFYMPRLVEKIEQDSPTPLTTTMDPNNASSSQLHTQVISPASPSRMNGDMGYDFKGCTSSSYDMRSMSSETEKVTNPVELSELQPVMNIDSPFVFGAAAQQQYSEIEDNSVLFSGDSINCYYMDDSNSYDMDNMDMPGFFDSNIADHGLFVDGMIYDPWSIDRLW